MGHTRGRLSVHHGDWHSHHAISLNPNSTKLETDDGKRTLVLRSSQHFIYYWRILS